MAAKSSVKNKSALTGTNAADVLTVQHSEVTVKAGKGNDKITVSKGAGNVLYGGTGADTITIGKSAGKGNKVYGDAGNDTIKVSAKYGVTINGGAGNDKLYGGKGNDTFTGDKGKDTFFYANGGGKDTITDYQAGEDKLQITSGSISKTAVAKNKKDLVFTVGKGTITLKNAAGKKISMKDTRGTYTMNNKLITLGKDFTGTMDATKYVSTIKSIDARNVAKAVNITGNSQANRILPGRGGGTYKCGAGNDTIEIDGNGEYTVHGNDGKDTILIKSSTKCTVYGDAGDDNININGVGTGNTVYGNDGNDTIHVTNGKNVIDGGAGNDTIIIVGGSSHIISCGAGADTIHIVGGLSHIISGGAGADTFNYTSGTATIRDYAAEDTLSFTSAITGVTVSGQNINLTVGFGGSVTVENGVGKLTRFNNGDQKTSILYAEDDINFGTDNGEIIIANSADDIKISAQGGDDYLYGGYWQNGDTGNDHLFSGSSTQHMFGGGDSDKDVFYFSSDSYKGEIRIYDFIMYDDMIEFMDEGENSVYADSDPWRDGSDVCLRLSSGSNLRFVDYASDMIRYADLHNSLFGAMAVDD